MAGIWIQTRCGFRICIIFSNIVFELDLNLKNLNHFTLTGYLEKTLKWLNSSFDSTKLCLSGLDFKKFQMTLTRQKWLGHIRDTVLSRNSPAWPAYAKPQTIFWCQAKFLTWQISDFRPSAHAQSNFPDQKFCLHFRCVGERDSRWFISQALCLCYCSNQVCVLTVVRTHDIDNCLLNIFAW